MLRPALLTPIACGLVILYLQVSKIRVYFGSFAAVLDPTKRLRHVDFPVVEYQMEVSRHLFAATGKLWGYDPFFLNGFPHSFLWNSNVFLQVIANLLPEVSSSQILKYFFVACVVVEPFLVWGALRAFGVGREASLWSTLVALLYLKLSHPVVFLVIGMVTAYLLFPLFLFAMALLYRAARPDPPLVLRLSLPLVLALCLLVHKTFLVLAAPVCAVIGARLLRERRYADIAYFCAAFGVAFGLNGFWIWPAYEMRHYLDFAYNDFFRDPLIIFDVEWKLVMGERALGAVNGSYLVFIAILVLSILGFRELRQRNERLISKMVAWTMGSTLFLILFSPLIPFLSNLHAVRFWFGLGIFATAPMAFGLERAFRAGPPSQSWAAPVLFFMLTASALELPSLERTIEANIAAGGPTMFQKMPLFRFDEDRLAREANALRSWLQENVAREEVIFLSTHPGNHYMSGLYVGTGLRFVSAPYNYIFLRQNYVNRYFQDYFRDVMEPPHLWRHESRFRHGPEDFEKLARFFRVRWWVIDRTGSERDLSEVRGMELVKSLGDYDIYRYNAPMSEFLLGSGRVEVDYGRIVIRDARAHEGGSFDGLLILKMHWFDGIQVHGADSVGPHIRPGFPSAFIRIEKPEPTVVLVF